MKEEIHRIVEEYPRHFTFKLRKNEEYNSAIMKSTGHLDEECSYSERVYNYIFGSVEPCEFGKKKKFVSFNKGYQYCGNSSKCECCKKSVSESVSMSKRCRSTRDIEKENKKRILTNKKKYGVDNVGKLAIAKCNHKAFYNNDEKVSGVVSKVKETKQIRYGNENYNNPESISATWRNKSDTEKKLIYLARNASYKKNNPPMSQILLSSWFEKLKEKYTNDLGVELLCEESDYVGVSNQVYYSFRCLTCNYEFKTYVDNGNLPICKKCNPSSRVTKPVREIIEYLEEIGIGNYLVNDRTVLEGKELDIYIPDKLIAIEYNGLYWHTEDRVGKFYHYDKFSLCLDKGIKLISIFSDEWIHNKNVVKKRLSYIMGDNDRTIGARKCDIRVVSKDEMKTFLNNNHVQGHISANICYGLYYNDELVSLMSFGKMRYKIKEYRGKVVYEMLRFASSCSVPGGASRLLNTFLKNHDVDILISYSKNEWGSGELYKILGFEKDEIILPSYYYVDTSNEVRIHRMNYQKKKLVEDGYDPQMTEFEIMELRGYKRIWDCGNIRWILKIS